MNGANKILTVSYGTFSCTLEGFDDPFTTMKAIAEYFRNLAAEDRYFGAEPPTPDAAMLHHIAEKEVQRRVEAKINENGVLLKAGAVLAAEPQPAPELPAATPAAAPQPPAATTDSAAAMLTRMRSAVTEDPAPETAAIPADYLEDEEAGPDLTDPTDFQIEPEADFGAEIDLVALTAAVADATPEPDHAAPEADYDDLSILTDAMQDAAQDEADLSAVLEHAPEEAIAASDMAAIVEDMPLSDLVAGIVADVDTASSTLSERVNRARARVIRIRKPDEAVTATEEASPAETPVEAGLRTAVRPARPARAALPPAILTAETAPAEDDAPVAHPQFPEPAEAGEAAVSRLLAETNSQMAGVENRRRLSAIQHLKAAVAATVAERRAGAAKPVNEEDRIDPYRSVLSRMMRPGKETDHADHPAEPGPAPSGAPLVLVSAQRVDPVAPPPAAASPEAMAPAPPPVLLTNLVTREEDELAFDGEDLEEIDADAALFADTRGFADFAERLGADNLPAMLEAAAAYAACIEGRPHFSRPQIMRQVTAMTSDNASREDALRSFGALLRTGRIVKVKRGQYALSDSNNLLAEARKLVG